MLPRADLTSIRPVAAIDAPRPLVTVADARQDTLALLSRIALGQQVRATVLSMLEDGSALARVADAVVRLNLPVQAKVGDTLQLIKAGTEPRPTFLLAPGAQAEGGATTTVSAAGRLIDHLLQNARRDGAPAALQGNAPLLKSAQMPPAQIATALRTALEFSGLFYESHLAQWTSGHRTLPDVLREPQAQEARQLAAQAAQAGAARTAEPAADAPARQTTQLIPLQLETLEQQRVLWRGELWPGQPLEWEIGRDDGSEDDGGQQRAAGTDAEPAWHSVVRFELPRLGKVSAALRLAGDRLQLQLRTETDDAALALRRHGGQLSEALAAAGSTLESLKVQRDAAGT